MGREEDCEELSLELSIGVKYGKKSEELGEKPRDFCGNGENLNPSCDFDEVMMDPQRTREIQASRRQEARRKREEKVRKSRGNVNAAGFFEDRSFLEEQTLRGRAGDREIRENDCFSEGKTRKIFKEDCSRSDELGLSLFSEKKECVLYPKVQLAEGKSSASVNLSDSDNGVKSSEQCSSAVSDYHSNSQKGGSNSDTGCSHPSPFRQRHPGAVDQVDSFDRSAKLAPKRSPSEEGTAPEARSSNNAARLPQMPCVSATGNGPNGTTVTGFLYRYSTTEVSIVCVCHGSLFSPAEFVKHAGGVDVSHPLRHITVVTR